MKYIITKQYARDTENPIAEFCDQNDANFFIQRKLLADDEKNVIIIYRLFENQKLLKEFNKDKVTSLINSAQYAEGDRDLPYSLSPFSVSKENSVKAALAAFIDLSDAELFVEDRLTHTRIITTYYIFKNDELIFELNQRIKKKALTEESSQGKGRASSFQPTPLNITLRPKGAPANWIKDEDEGEDENK